MTPEQSAALREKFPPELIGQLPKGGVMLDFVGHAAVTDRLLKVDPEWTWEPMALTPEGLPALDRAGNLWIRLTIGGVTRPGVGDGKNAKECVSDAIRNAAMRFGVALDLWSKQDLDGHDPQASPATPTPAGGGKTPEQSGAAATPDGPAPPSKEDLTALFELVKAKGGDEQKTMVGAQTAEEKGLLANWYQTALKHWEAQPKPSEFRVPERAAKKAAA